MKLRYKIVITINPPQILIKALGLYPGALIFKLEFRSSNFD